MKKIICSEDTLLCLVYWPAVINEFKPQQRSYTHIRAKSPCLGDNGSKPLPTKFGWITWPKGEGEWVYRMTQGWVPEQGGGSGGNMKNRTSQLWKRQISLICTNMPQTFKMSHELHGYFTLLRSRIDWRIF